MVYKIVGRWEPTAKITHNLMQEELFPIIQELGVKIGIGDYHETTLRDPESNIRLLRISSSKSALSSALRWHQDGIGCNDPNINLLLWASAWPTWIRLREKPSRILVPPRYSIVLVNNIKHEHRMPPFPHQYPRWVAVSRLGIPQPNVTYKTSHTCKWYSISA